MIVAGIDSAEQTGWALVRRDEEGEHLLAYGIATVRLAADVERLAGELVTAAPDVVAVEEPFVHPRNFSTGLALARLLGRWLQAFEVRGVTAVTIPASMWQRAVLAGVGGRTRSAERKAAAQAFVLERFGVEVGEDAADAIAMAVYVARTATRRAA